MASPRPSLDLEKIATRRFSLPTLVQSPPSPREGSGQEEGTAGGARLRVLAAAFAVALTHNSPESWDRLCDRLRQNGGWESLPQPLPAQVEYYVRRCCEFVQTAECRAAPGTQADTLHLLQQRFQPAMHDSSATFTFPKGKKAAPRQPKAPRRLSASEVQEKRTNDVLKRYRTLQSDAKLRHATTVRSRRRSLGSPKLTPLADKTGGVRASAPTQLTSSAPLPESPQPQRDLLAAALHRLHRPPQPPAQAPELDRTLEGQSGEEVVKVLTARRHRPLHRDFVYLNYAESRTHQPYSLVSVPKAQAKTEHVVMSNETVVLVAEDATTTMPVEQWQREALLFRHTAQIRFFKTFLLCKHFRAWRAGTIRQRLASRGKSLSRNHLALHSQFRAVYAEARQHIAEACSSPCLSLDKSATYTGSEWDAAIDPQLETLAASLDTAIDAVHRLLAKLEARLQAELMQEQRDLEWLQAQPLSKRHGMADRTAAIKAHRTAVAEMELNGARLSRLRRLLLLVLKQALADQLTAAVCETLHALFLPWGRRPGLLRFEVARDDRGGLDFAPNSATLKGLVADASGRLLDVLARAGCRFAHPPSSTSDPSTSHIHSPSQPHSAELKAMASELQGRSPRVEAALELIWAAVDEAYAEVTTSLRGESWLLEAQDFVEAWTEKSLASWQAHCTSILPMLKRLRGWQASMRGLSISIRSSNTALCLDCRSFHIHVLPRLTAIERDLNAVLATELHEFSQLCHDRLSSDVADLRQRVQMGHPSAEEYASFVDALATGKGRRTKRQEEVEYLSALFKERRAVDSFTGASTIDASLVALEESIHKTWSEFNGIVGAAQQLADVVAPMMTHKLKLAVKAQEELAYRERAALSTGAFVRATARADEVLAELALTSSRLEAVRVRAHELRRALAIVSDEPVAPLVELPQALDLLRARRRVWELLAEMQASLRAWRGADFPSVDWVAASRACAAWQAQVADLRPSLPSQDGLVARLERMSHQFSALCPTLVSLQAESFASQQWDTLFAAMGVRGLPGVGAATATATAGAGAGAGAGDGVEAGPGVAPRVTLRTLVARGLPKYARLVRTLAEHSDCAAGFQAQLNAMRQHWKTAPLPLAPFHPTAVAAEAAGAGGALGTTLGPAAGLRPASRQRRASLMRSSSDFMAAARRSSIAQVMQQELAADAEVLALGDTQGLLDTARRHLAILHGAEADLAPDPRQQAQALEAKLHRFVPLLEAWSACQELWLYLQVAVSHHGGAGMPRAAETFGALDERYQRLLRLAGQQSCALILQEPQESSNPAYRNGRGGRDRPPLTSLLRQPSTTSPTTTSAANTTAEVPGLDVKRELSHLGREMRGLVERVDPTVLAAARATCPRFHFLSDPHLRAVLAHPYDVSAGEVGLVRCLTNVCGLVHETRRATPGATGTAAETVTVTGLLGEDGVQLRFKEPVRILPGAELCRWHALVVERMREAVRTSIGAVLARLPGATALHALGPGGLAALLRDHPLQSLLFAYRCRFAELAQAAVDDPAPTAALARLDAVGDRIRADLQLLQDVQGQQQQNCEQLPVEEAELPTPVAVVALRMAATDALRVLGSLRPPIDGVLQRLSWEKYLRCAWVENDGSGSSDHPGHPAVLVMDHHLPYMCEFDGAAHRAASLHVLPHTADLLLNLALGAVDPSQSRVCGLEGPAGSGRGALVAFLGHLLGRHVVHARLQGERGPPSVLRLVRGTLLGGAWCIFKDAHLLSGAAQASLTQLLSLVGHGDPLHQRLDGLGAAEGLVGGVAHPAFALFYTVPAAAGLALPADLQARVRIVRPGGQAGQDILRGLADACGFPHPHKAVQRLALFAAAVSTSAFEVTGPLGMAADALRDAFAHGEATVAGLPGALARTVGRVIPDERAFGLLLSAAFPEATAPPAPPPAPRPTVSPPLLPTPEIEGLVGAQEACARRLLAGLETHGCHIIHSSAAGVDQKVIAAVAACHHAGVRVRHLHAHAVPAGDLLRPDGVLDRLAASPARVFAVLHGFQPAALNGLLPLLHGPHLPPGQPRSLNCFVLLGLEARVSPELRAVATVSRLEADAEGLIAAQTRDLGIHGASRYPRLGPGNLELLTKTCLKLCTKIGVFLRGRVASMSGLVQNVFALLRAVLAARFGVAVRDAPASYTLAARHLMLLSAAQAVSLACQPFVAAGRPRQQLDALVKAAMEAACPGIPLPEDPVAQCRLDTPNRRLVGWTEAAQRDEAFLRAEVPHHDGRGPGAPYFVHTPETWALGQLIPLLQGAQSGLLLVGPRLAGKTSLVRHSLRRLPGAFEHIPLATTVDGASPPDAGVALRLRQLASEPPLRQGVGSGDIHTLFFDDVEPGLLLKQQQGQEARNRAEAEFAALSMAVAHGGVWDPESQTVRALPPRGLVLAGSGSAVEMQARFGVERPVLWLDGPSELGVRTILRPLVRGWVMAHPESAVGSYPDLILGVVLATAHLHTHLSHDVHDGSKPEPGATPRAGGAGGPGFNLRDALTVVRGMFLSEPRYDTGPGRGSGGLDDAAAPLARFACLWANEVRRTVGTRCFDERSRAFLATALLRAAQSGFGLPLSPDASTITEGSDGVAGPAWCAVPGPLTSIYAHGGVLVGEAASSAGYCPISSDEPCEALTHLAVQLAEEGKASTTGVAGQSDGCVHPSQAVAVAELCRAIRPGRFESQSAVLLHHEATDGSRAAALAARASGLACTVSTVASPAEVRHAVDEELLAHPRGAAAKPRVLVLRLPRPDGHANGDSANHATAEGFAAFLAAATAAPHLSGAEAGSVVRTRAAPAATATSPAAASQRRARRHKKRSVQSAAKNWQHVRQVRMAVNWRRSAQRRRGDLPSLFHLEGTRSAATAWTGAAQLRVVLCVPYPEDLLAVGARAVLRAPLHVVGLGPPTAADCASHVAQWLGRATLPDGYPVQDLCTLLVRMHASLFESDIGGGGGDRGMAELLGLCTTVLASLTQHNATLFEHNHGLLSALARVRALLANAQQRLEEHRPTRAAAEARRRECEEQAVAKRAAHDSLLAGRDEANSDVESLLQPMARFQNDLQAELKLLKPLKRRAQASLSRLNRKDLEELALYPDPPASVVLTVSPLVLLFRRHDSDAAAGAEKSKKRAKKSTPSSVAASAAATGKGVAGEGGATGEGASEGGKAARRRAAAVAAPPTWAEAKLLFNREHFFASLATFDPETVSAADLAAALRIVESPEFDPQRLKRASAVCEHVAEWALNTARHAQGHHALADHRERLGEAVHVMESARKSSRKLLVKADKCQAALALAKAEAHEARAVAAEALKRDRELQQRVLRLEQAVAALDGLQERSQTTEEALVLNDALPATAALAAGVALAAARSSAGAGGDMDLAGLVAAWRRDAAEAGLVLPEAGEARLSQLLAPLCDLELWSSLGVCSTVATVDELLAVLLCPRCPVVFDRYGTLQAWLTEVVHPGPAACLVSSHDRQCGAKVLEAMGDGRAAIVTDICTPIAQLLAEQPELAAAAQRHRPCSPIQAGRGGLVAHTGRLYLLSAVRQPSAGGLGVARLECGTRCALRLQLLRSLACAEEPGAQGEAAKAVKRVRRSRRAVVELDVALVACVTGIQSEQTAAELGLSAGRIQTLVADSAAAEEQGRHALQRLNDLREAETRSAQVAAFLADVYVALDRTATTAAGAKAPTPVLFSEFRREVAACVRELAQHRSVGELMGDAGLTCMQLMQHIHAKFSVGLGYEDAFLFALALCALDLTRLADADTRAGSVLSALLRAGGGGGGGGDAGGGGVGLDAGAEACLSHIDEAALPCRDALVQHAVAHWAAWREYFRTCKSITQPCPFEPVAGGAEAPSMATVVLAASLAKGETEAADGPGVALSNLQRLALWPAANPARFVQLAGDFVVATLGSEYATRHTLDLQRDLESNINVVLCAPHTDPVADLRAAALVRHKTGSDFAVLPCGGLATHEALLARVADAAHSRRWLVLTHGDRLSHHRFAGVCAAWDEAVLAHSAVSFRNGPMLWVVRDLHRSASAVASQAYAWRAGVFVWQRSPRIRAQTLATLARIKQSAVFAAADGRDAAADAGGGDGGGDRGKGGGEGGQSPRQPISRRMSFGSLGLYVARSLGAAKHGLRGSGAAGGGDGDGVGRDHNQRAMLLAQLHSVLAVRSAVLSTCDRPAYTWGPADLDLAIALLFGGAGRGGEAVRPAEACLRTLHAVGLGGPWEAVVYTHVLEHVTKSFVVKDLKAKSAFGKLARFLTFSEEQVGLPETGARTFWETGQLLARLADVLLMGDAPREEVAEVAQEEVQEKEAVVAAGNADAARRALDRCAAVADSALVQGTVIALRGVVDRCGEEGAGPFLGHAEALYTALAQPMAGPGGTPCFSAALFFPDPRAALLHLMGVGGAPGDFVLDITEAAGAGATPDRSAGLRLGGCRLVGASWDAAAGCLQGAPGDETIVLSVRRAAAEDGAEVAQFAAFGSLRCIEAPQGADWVNCPIRTADGRTLALARLPRGAQPAAHWYLRGVFLQLPPPLCVQGRWRY